MTLPADKTGNPCMSGPRPATPFTETSSCGFPRHSNLGRFFCTISNLLFFLSSRSKQESGFWSWRVQAGDPGHQSHCARGSECPSESQFPVLIEGGIPFAENHINIVISKAAFSEIKHSSPVV